MMKYQHTPIRMAKNMDNTKSWQGCTQNGSLIHYCLQKNGIIILENSLEISLKMQLLLWLSNCTPRYLPQKNKDLYSHKTPCLSAYQSFIPKSPKRKTIQMFLKRWIVKLNVHNHTKEYHSAIKRSKLLIYAIAWMNLQRIVLNVKVDPKSLHIA